MIRLLFIGAGFFQSDGLRFAKEKGYYVIAVDGDPEAYGKGIAHEFRHIDIMDKELVLQYAKRKRIDAVLSIASEVSMDTLGYLNCRLGLAGYKEKHVTISHNKDVYYKVLNDSKILIPKTYIGEPFEPLHPNLNYYIKPSRGSGSRGVLKVSGGRSFDFDQYRDEFLKPGEEIIVQEEVKGKEITVDGFIIDRKFHLLAVSEQFNDSSKRHNFSTELVFPPQWIMNSHLKEILNTCNTIIDALGIDENGPMHLEFIVTESENLYLIDFSLRGGGFDVFTKITMLTSGVDVLDKYIESTLGRKIDIKLPAEFKPVTLSFAYPECKGTIRSLGIDNLDGDQHYFRFIYKEGQQIDMPTSGSERLAYFICWADTYDQVFSIRDKLRSQIIVVIES